MPVDLVVTEIHTSEWPAIVGRFSDLTFEQSLAYSRAAAARIGGELRLLAVEHQGQPVAVAAVRLKRVPGLGRGIAWCPSGPLLCRLGTAAPQADEIVGILSALCEEVCGHRGHVLRLRLPGTSLSGTGLDETALAKAAGLSPWAGRPPYRSFVLDLTQGEDRLMQRLNGKWRTDLRFALKSALTLERGDDEGLRRRFLALFDTIQQQKGFRPEIPPEFHFALAGPSCPADYGLDILIARHAGQDVAGIVVGTSGPTATYLFGATGEAGRPLRAGYFLTWEAIRLAAARGVLWYDLGGVDFATNPDVSRFKERMGGEAIEAHAFEARPSGLAVPALLGLERLYYWLKERG